MFAKVAGADVRAADGIGDNTITIFDVIGEDFWTGGGVTVNRIDAALRSIGNKAVEVHINSPGGDVFEGLAIYNRLLSHPAGVTVKVLGLAASAASIIAMAGSRIEMGPGAMMMVHSSHVISAGNADDHEEVAGVLRAIDDSMIGVYAQRTGRPESEIRKLVHAETWMGAQAAVDGGFADAVTETGISPEAALGWDFTNAPFKNVPAALRRSASREPTKVESKAQLERLLRETCGLSKAAADIAARAGYAALAADPTPENSAIVAELNAHAARLRTLTKG